MKDVFCPDTYRVWFAAAISTTSTALSWFNVVNAALTTIVLIGSVIYTWRKILHGKKNNE